MRMQHTGTWKWRAGGYAYSYALNPCSKRYWRQFQSQSILPFSSHVVQHLSSVHSLLQTYFWAHSQTEEGLHSCSCQRVHPCQLTSTLYLSVPLSMVLAPARLIKVNQHMAVKGQHCFQAAVLAHRSAHDMGKHTTLIESHCLWEQKLHCVWCQHGSEWQSHLECITCDQIMPRAKLPRKSAS